MRFKASLKRSIAIIMAVVVIFNLNLNISVRADDEDYSQGFQLWFNQDGSSGISKGLIGSYPVWAGADMNGQTNSISVGNIERYVVQGSDHAQIMVDGSYNNPNGKIPEKGTYIKVKAPENGKMIFYMEPVQSSGTIFYATKGDTPTISKESPFTEAHFEVSVKKDEEWYFYLQGGNGKYAGVVFEKEVIDYSKGFEYWFSPQTKTNILAGQQGDYPIWTGEAMEAKDNVITVGDDNNHFNVYAVQGVNNPTVKDNTPTAGAYIKVKAPAKGRLTVYINPISGNAKTICASLNGTLKISIDSPPYDKNNIQVSVNTDEEWYFYVSGSKAKFYGVVFEPGNFDDNQSGGNENKPSETPDQGNGTEIDITKGFNLWFNTNGSTSVKAGQQGSYPVFAKIDMAAKTDKLEIGQNIYYSVQGTDNPKKGGSNANGAIPDSGAYLSVKAPANGTLTVYLAPVSDSGKIMYATKGTIPAIAVNSPFTDNSFTVQVAKDEEWYFYVQGSKGKFFGVTFDLPKPEHTIPVTFAGADLGSAKITLKNKTLNTETTITKSDSSIKLMEGYKYSVSINSAQHTIDLEELDLTGNIPTGITITAAAAAKHTVSGKIKGLPSDVKVTKLSFEDEAKVMTEATVTGDSYSVQLKNGNYTTWALLSVADKYYVWDHVAVTKTDGDVISNNVWFYEVPAAYPKTYKDTLHVGKGQGNDYTTITEAIAAAKAMTRSSNQYVTIILHDEEYVEQVIVDAANVKLTAAEGVTPTIRWYYGIGYKYYSIDSTGYYNVLSANDKYEMHYAQRWGSTVRIAAEGFIAEGIEFLNTFNRYVCEEESGDSKVGNAAEYGQSISSTLEERTSTTMDVANLKNVERAAAVVVDKDKAEFYKCTFISSQDTLYTGSAASYYNECVIVGQTDYIFGNDGTKAIFDNCELRWLGYTGASSKEGYITATRGSYLFRNCIITNSKEADHKVTAGYYGRPWNKNANVIFLNTTVENNAIAAAAWKDMSGVKPEDVKFLEYGNTCNNTAFYSTFAADGAATKEQFRLTEDDAKAYAEYKKDSTYLGTWIPTHYINPSAKPETTPDNNNSGVDENGKRIWGFTTYGPSITSNRDVNGYSGDANKGTVTVYSLNGKGKIITATTDGLSYYYTTIDAEKENFVLEADVHVDQWTLSNGQEGFGLIASDTIGPDGDENTFWNNSIENIVSKVDYYYQDGKIVDDITAPKISMKLGIGTLVRQGVTKEDKQSFLDNGRFTYSDGSMNDIPENFQSNMYTLETSCAQYGQASYNIIGNYTTEPLGTQKDNLITDMHMSITRNNTGYYVTTSYKNKNGETVSGTKRIYDIKDNEDSGILTQIDSKNIYVGFFAARNAKITFSNIKLTTSNRATDPAAEEREIEKITPYYSIESASTSNSSNYDLVYYGNADGKLKIVDSNNKVIANNLSVTANRKNHFSTKIEKGETTYTITFTPNSDYKPGKYSEMSSYASETFTHTVSYQEFTGDTIYVAPDGTGSGSSKADPTSIFEAVKYVKPGQTIILAGGTYLFEGGFKIDRGIDGTPDHMIYMIADPDSVARPIFDFQKKGSGMTIVSSYWYLKGFDVARSADAMKGLQVSGNNNVLDSIRAYENGNSGIQIARYKPIDLREDWPSNNLILNCSAYFNADKGYEDADGFAAKITVGEGNIFDGCIAAYNADDGWDLFAKAEQGPIGKVIVRNSVAFMNGYLLDKDGKLIDAGNGNGFKLGGGSISGYHTIINSVAFANKAKGIDCNSCPDIQVYNCTSFDNESYNVAFYTNTAVNTDFYARGILSYKKSNDIWEQMKLKGTQDTSKVLGVTNYYTYGVGKSYNTSNTRVSDDWFVNMNTADIIKNSNHDLLVNAFGLATNSASKGITRNSDGTIKMNGYLELTEKADPKAGARLNVYVTDIPTEEIPPVTPDSGNSSTPGTPDNVTTPNSGIADSGSIAGNNSEVSQNQIYEQAVEKDNHLVKEISKNLTSLLKAVSSIFTKDVTKQFSVSKMFDMTYFGTDIGFIQGMTSIIAQTDHVNAGTTISDYAVSEKLIHVYSGEWKYVNKKLAETMQNSGKEIEWVFDHNGHTYRVTIPPNVNLVELLDENGFAGPLYIGKMVGKVEILF